MANTLLRLGKGAMTAKLQLSLFTTSLDDNKDLAARVAHLESELAGVALSYGQQEEALHALVAAAAAYKELGDLRRAAACLGRCRGLNAGDAETRALLDQAMVDLSKQLVPASAPKAAPAPPPAPAPAAAPALAPALAPKKEGLKAVPAKKRGKKSSKKQSE